jgi:outer membrane protein OmpA-like peptidoglycan-associated protein
MYRKLFLVLLLPLLAGSPAPGLFAQDAQTLENLLAAPTVSYADAADFVYKAADRGGAAELPKGADPQQSARVDGAAYLVMNAFNLKGGIFYSLFKNPHYAYREMVQQKVIQWFSDPMRDISGEQLVYMVNRALALSEAEAEVEAAKARKEAEAEARRLAAEREKLAAEINKQLAAMAAEQAKAAEAAGKKAEEPHLTATVTEEGVTISLQNIQFVADSAVLMDSEKGKLDEVAAVLKGVPGRPILVEGHTALAGTEEGRLQTSIDRAQAVAAYLVEQGARTVREITVRGHGAEKPIASNDTDEGMALNRRVEITILEGK